MAKKRFPEDLKFAGETIRYAFDSWQPGTLGELQSRLEEVRDEMESFDSDDLIEDHWDELTVAADYVLLFGDVTEQVEELDLPLDFDYRLANVEEDIQQVEELIEGLGESFKFANLPKPKYMRKTKTKAA
jgi:hypothetical protein